MSRPSRPDVALVQIRVVPRASRDEIVGFNGEVLKVRVTAPPEGGRANEALLLLLAERFGCPRSVLTLVRGQRSREKLVRVSGHSLQEIQARLSLNGRRS